VYNRFITTKEIIMAKAPMKKEAPSKGKFTFPPAKGAVKIPASKAKKAC
jgi:hypothetical protein